MEFCEKRRLDETANIGCNVTQIGCDVAQLGCNVPQMVVVVVVNNVIKLGYYLSGSFSLLSEFNC
jgi:hypothetical protein